MKNTDYLEQIVERLKKTDPYKIILFGSHAYGDAQKDSDIDLIVVLNNNDMPKTFKEKMRYQLLVRNAILDINKEIPIDLIVYTKPMFEKFNHLGSMFSKEIAQKGKIIYEAGNKGVA